MVADAPAAVREARQLVVVDQHGHAVAREVHVGLEDRRAVREGASERGQRVLGRHARGPAVPDDDRRRQREEGMPHRPTVSCAARWPS